MRRISLVVLLVVFLATLAPPVTAGDESFAIRFGLTFVEPQGSTRIEGERTEFDEAFGGEFDFEWYVTDFLGLEASIGTAFDADVEEDGDEVAGITITPLTAGLNLHLVRNADVDWYVGVLAGWIFYGDFEYEDKGSRSESSYSSEDDTAWGLQTAVDIGIGEDGRWGVNLGLKWLDSEVDLDRVSRPIEVDPFIARVRGTYRW